MAAAACGVSPALTSEPRARALPVMSPARNAEKSRAAAGSSFSLEFLGNNRAQWFQKGMEHLPKRLTH